MAALSRVLLLLQCLLFLVSVQQCQAFHRRLAFSPIFRRSVHHAYRKTLEQQVGLMDRQLRTTREEAAQLRNLLKVSQQTVRKGSLDEKRAQSARETALRQALTELQTHAKQLESLRDELQELIASQDAKIAQLKQQLAETKESSEQAKVAYEKELEALQARLVRESKQQLQALQELMDRRVQDAVRQTRTQVEADYQKKMQDQQSKAVSQLQEERQRSQQAVEKAELQLQEERQRSQQAVEKERIKMRKLVKALAVKEKKLLDKAEQQMVKTTTTSSSSPSRRPTPRMASPIKK